MSPKEEVLATSPGFPEKPAETSVPILSALARRWSPVRFDSRRDIGKDDLRGVLEAARWAPSSFGEEPWRFLVARRQDPHREAMEGALSEGNWWARDASVLLVSVAKETFTRNGKPNRFFAHDTGLATSALLAEATHRGLISHPMGGFHTGKIREAFQVPEGFTILAMIALGWHDPEVRTRPFGSGRGQPAGAAHWRIPSSEGPLGTPWRTEAGGLRGAGPRRILAVSGPE